jgi:pyruvate formate lyase activating enzyme
LTQSDYPGRWWMMLPDVRIECRLCPRFCKLNPPSQKGSSAASEGQRGFCFVRQRVGDRIVLTTYGRSSGFCIDPIEKKPLNHFLPGTSVLSFGTAGCNLGCRFCQNWDISKAREWDKIADAATPERIALAAQRLGCRSVASNLESSQSLRLGFAVTGCEQVTKEPSGNEEDDARYST